MSLENVFQAGYVTRDIDRAVSIFSERLGLSEFSHFDIELELRTATGANSAEMRVGTAWAGMMQIELIQPVSGHVDAYLAGLPEDPDDATPRFHHLAVRRDSEQVMRRDVAALGVPVVFETGGNGLASIFVDARPLIGHHLEFVCATPEGWAMLDWPG